MLPIGAYLSWNGLRFEGTGISPDVSVDWSPDDYDDQLKRAIETVRAL
jgi:C-terminal processing protease CtpA/Prc